MTDPAEEPSLLIRDRKYGNSVRTLLPYRRRNKSIHPVDNAGCFSTFLFSWLSGLVWRLNKKTITINDLWKTPHYDEADRNCTRFLRIWETEVKANGDSASLKKVFFRFIRTRLILSMFFCLMFTLCQFASNGIIIRELLKHLEAMDLTLKTSVILVVSMIVVESSRAIFFSLMFTVNMRTGVRVRAGMLLAVFKKVLRMRSISLSSVGEVVNLCSSDGDRLFEAMYLGPMVVGGPFIFLVGSTYVTAVVGPVALAGCGVLLLLFITLGFTTAWMNKLRQKAVKFTEERVKNINEVLSSIKLIKMYAWEECFNKIVREVRSKERAVLYKTMLLQNFNIGLANVIPFIASIATVVLAVIAGRDMTVSEVFTCVTLFNVIAFSLKVTPLSLKYIADASVAIDRIKVILQRTELEDYVAVETSSPDIAVEMKEATLSWPREDAENVNEGGIEGHDQEKLLNSNEIQLEKFDEESGSRQLPPCLENITLTVTKGSMFGVCGSVGSGKSSLISAILGQMELTYGTVALKGLPAYGAQQAWIMNATIRDNITFGLPYEPTKYKRIVTACCLLPDFEILQSGDFTEVGERGMNLSGGQKQRISLARALYLDKDVYLFDDPLSAVDAHVGQSIFKNVFQNELKDKGKTVILVTHRMEYLPYCDTIALMKAGKLWEIGNHEDLFDRGEEYYTLYRTWSKQKQSEENREESGKLKPGHDKDPLQEIINNLTEEDKIEGGRLMTAEGKSEGKISWKVYRAYMEAAGGCLPVFVCMLLYMLFTCSQQFSIFWLSYMFKRNQPANSGVFAGNYTTVSTYVVNNTVSGTSQFSNESTEVAKPISANSEVSVGIYAAVTELVANSTASGTTEFYRIVDNEDIYFHVKVLSLAVLGMLLMTAIKACVATFLSLRASNVLHNKLFEKILHGTMEFFDTTPTGRILNRFQKDQDVLDTVTPYLSDVVLSFGFFMLSCIAFVGYVFPYFLGVVAIIAPLFLVGYFLFKGAVREMRRLDNITRSPLFSHIATTVNGIPTIRAYKRTDDFVSMFMKHMDVNTVPYYLYVSVTRWMVTRMDFLTLAIVGICSILVVVSQEWIPPAYAALALSSSLLMTLLFQITVRFSVECEASLVSAERINDYITTVPVESTGSDLPSLRPKWPANGAIEFKNVCMRYRDGLPLVLNNVTFCIEPSEKIGIVGRTGSGKSSLGVSLFRLVQLADGEIVIDGINTADLSLRQLRSKLAIIPQDPVLFSGTLRFNLDPFSSYSDERIWEALEHTHLKDVITSLPKKLEAPVSEDGSNFSMGERQLMCLARALLRNNKILLLDEATASIDAETDRLVQGTINEHFANCTLITIAHRLHTVMTCDRVMVMDQGAVVEFDTPQTLSKNPNSHLSKLLSSTME